MLVFKTQLEKDILELLENSMNTMGYYILRIRINQGKKSKTLQLMIERNDAKAVSIDDCEKASKQASLLLDLHDIIKDKYYLEVSSPGINRPLTRLEDFAKYSGGSNVKLVLNTPINGQRRFTGVLCGLSANNITLKLQDSDVEPVKIPVLNISEANVEHELLIEVKNKSRGRNAAK